jgi:tyrosyl-tRNA synthetase
MAGIEEQVRQLMLGTEYGDENLRASMEAELRERLSEAERDGRPLRVYCGYDPRTGDLHLGHTITMRKLRQFQDFGHEVTFLIGNYTSLIGDPSDKDRQRPILSPEQVAENARTYAEQAFKVLDPARTRVRYNAEWLSELSFAELIGLASNFTIQQFLVRENFSKRFEKGEPIYLHETFYAIMQGYDAVAQQADVQVGGTDQLFNIIVAGRKLQEALGQRPQVGIIMGILPGTDGVVRMSKSLGNHIQLLAPPEDMYGKIMSVPDVAMPLYARLVTRFTPAEVAAFLADLESGRLHPRDAKMRLAREIVSIFHSPEAVLAAEAHFTRVFQQHALPADMPEHALSGPRPIVDLLVELDLARSRGEARRLIEQGGVRLDGEPITAFDRLIAPADGQVLQVGKRRFVRLTAG